jgi:uncharacterized protein YdeI (YjbR/CyaY-like superfamily)
MPKIDPRIDTYIKKSADFAKPVLEHLREVVHKACTGVEENIKWGFPHFEYKGSILCSMASFKQHCTFGFWKASIMKDPEGILQLMGKTAMGHMDRIESLKDLPSDKILIAYIKEAAKLNEDDVKLPPKKKSTEKKELIVPADLSAALKKNKKANATFEAFSYSNKKDYVEWITEAKTDVTRETRLGTAVEWMSEGKSRHWKYQKK